MRTLRGLISVFVVITVLGVGSAFAEQTRIKTPAAKKWWIVSAVALVAAHAFDARSSLGRYEANPLLQNSHGQFSSTRGFALKSGGTAGMLVLQKFLLKKQPDSARSFALVNLGTAAVVGTAAARNYH